MKPRRHPLLCFCCKIFVCVCVCVGNLLGSHTQCPPDYRSPDECLYRPFLFFLLRLFKVFLVTMYFGCIILSCGFVGLFLFAGFLLLLLFCLVLRSEKE